MINQDISNDWDAALAALAWQVDLGVTEVVQDSLQNSFDLPDKSPWLPRGLQAAAAGQTVVAKAVAAPVPAEANAVAMAEDIAASCDSLDALRDALFAYDLCEVKKGTRNPVFADGNPAARVLILTDAPDREAEAAGKPIAGRAGALLDRMFAAIGLGRGTPDTENAIYIASVMPWRPMRDGVLAPDDLAMMRPFVLRHIALADPDLIVTLGPAPHEVLLGTPFQRGQWAQALGKPLMPMAHPSHLLRNPLAKRDAWADLLAIRATLVAKAVLA